MDTTGPECGWLANLSSLPVCGGISGPGTAFLLATAACLEAALPALMLGVKSLASSALQVAVETRHRRVWR